MGLLRPGIGKVPNPIALIGGIRGDWKGVDYLDLLISTDKHD